MVAYREGERQQSKQVAKGREFAFKMYLASDLASNPVAHAFEAKHIFLRDAERGEGFRGYLEPVSINILII